MPDKRRGLSLTVGPSEVVKVQPSTEGAVTPAFKHKNKTHIQMIDALIFRSLVECAHLSRWLMENTVILTQLQEIYLWFVLQRWPTSVIPALKYSPCTSIASVLLIDLFSSDTTHRKAASNSSFFYFPSLSSQACPSSLCSYVWGQGRWHSVISLTRHCCKQTRRDHPAPCFISLSRKGNSFLTSSPLAHSCLSF